MPEPYTLDCLDLPADSEIIQLANHCPDIQFLRFADGEYIVKEGEEGSDIYLVLKGSCLVEHSAGHESEKDSLLAIVISETKNPAFVGEMAYFGSCPRTASVRSSWATHACRLTPSHLNIILDHYPGLTRVLCRQFTDRLRKTNEQLKSYHAKHAMKAEHVIRQPGEVVVRRGEKANELYQLVDGRLRCEDESALDESRWLVEGFIEPAAFFCGREYSVTLTAEAGTILAAIDSGSKAAIVRNYPELALALFQMHPDSEEA